MHKSNKEAVSRTSTWICSQVEYSAEMPVKLAFYCILNIELAGLDDNSTYKNISSCLVFVRRIAYHSSIGTTQGLACSTVLYSEVIDRFTVLYNIITIRDIS